MRIIAGERRGAKLETPRGTKTTRPITDRVKENLFNIIQTRVPGAVVLDLFAGTGSMGLEALSRGAEWATFVEKDAEATALLERNIEKLGYGDRSRVMRGSALNLRPGIRSRGLGGLGPGGLVFDLVFVDPPYQMVADELMRQTIGDSLGELRRMGGLADDGLVSVRQQTKRRAEIDWAGFQPIDTRRYGTMTLDFLAPTAPAEPG